MTTVPGVWSDVVWSSVHGFVVVTSGPFDQGRGTTQAIRVRDGLVIWQTPVGLLMLRALALPSGDVIVLGQEGTTGQAILCQPNATVLGWPAFGQNCCLLALEGIDHVAYIQVSGRTFVRQVLDGPRAEEQTIPIGLTSQGWLDVGRWTDTYRSVIQSGLRMICASERDSCWVGQPADATVGVVGVSPANAWFNVLLGAVGGPNPHVASDGGGNFCIAAPFNGGIVGFEICPPFPVLSAPPATVPTFDVFPRALTVLTFDGRGPVGADVDLYCAFTEGDPTVLVAANPTRRVVWLHDGPDLTPIPAALRPSLDEVWIECYRVVGESEAAAFARWRATLAAVAAQWSGAIGIVPMFYDQFVWTVQETVNAGAFACNLAREFDRVRTLALFALFRANGIIAHPELQVLLARLRAAMPTTSVRLVRPTVQVDRWTLDELLDGREFVGHDPNNPQQTTARVWVDNGAIYMSIGYPGVDPSYVGRTGVARKVK